MAIGSTVDENGVALDKARVKTGITGGNVITHFGLALDKEGNEIADRASIVVKQPNGAIFTHSWFKPNDEFAWQEKAFNSQMMHICCNVVSKEDYIKIGTDARGDFGNFMKLLASKITPLLKEVKWHFKICLVEGKGDNVGKWFPKIPKYNEFMEIDNGSGKYEVLTTKLSNNEYFEAPKPSAPTAPAGEAASDGFL